MNNSIFFPATLVAIFFAVSFTTLSLPCPEKSTDSHQALSPPWSMSSKPQSAVSLVFVAREGPGEPIESAG